MLKAVLQVSSWQRLCYSFGASAISLVTAAIGRKAKNINKFEDLINKSTGLDLVILSPVDEISGLARVLIDDLPNVESMLVINVGGSSTEAVFCVSGDVLDCYSLDLGTKYLSNNYVNDDPISETDYNMMNTYIADTLAKAGFPKDLNVPVVHTGGELDFLMKCGCKLHDYDFSKNHPKIAQTADFINFVNDFKYLSSNEMYNIWALNPKWMAGAVACNSIALAIAQRVRANYIIPSNRNIADGLIYARERNE